MRKIAIIKPCTEYEKEIILSYIDKNDKVMFFNNDEELLKSNEYENTEILLGEPDLTTIYLMKKLRWIQMTWAGANKYTSAPDFPDHIVLTSASGAYGHIISEYIISGLLALKKNLFQYRNQMKAGDWYRITGDDGTLEGKRVLILGTGNIGQETAKKLRCFGCYIVGMCRTEGKQDICFDEVHTIGSLDIQLENADIVIIALPGTKQTANMFNAEKINRMKSSAVLVNVGRGFIVNTDDLTSALQKGLLQGAVLDVTEPEPLPEKHLLRSMENVVLTPHISGVGWSENKFTINRILDIFAENLKHDLNGEPKRNVIDFNKGY